MSERNAKAKDTNNFEHSEKFWKKEAHAKWERKRRVAFKLTRSEVHFARVNFGEKLEQELEQFSGRRF